MTDAFERQAESQLTADGKYLFEDRQTGRRLEAERVSNVIPTATDQTTLGKHQRRQAIWGFSHSPDLIDKTKPLDPRTDKRQLDEIGDEAELRAGGTIAANRGTAFHSAIENRLRGAPAPKVPTAIESKVELALSALAAAGIELIDFERTVGITDLAGDGSIWSIAGTIDAIAIDATAKARDQVCALDWKTGALWNRYPHGTSAQLGGYVIHDFTFDWNASTFGPPIAGMSRDRALVVHVPLDAPGPRVDIYEVEPGIEAFRRAAWLKHWQERPDLITPFVPNTSDPKGDTSPRADLWRRVKALEERPGALRDLKRLWPSGVPRPLPDPLTDEQVFLFAGVLDRVEGIHEIPF